MYNSRDCIIFTLSLCYTVLQIMWMLSHVMFQKVHIRRRKEVEKRINIETTRFDRTEIMFSLRKNGGYIAM